MQTLNTDTKVESETPEQIAAQIVAMYYPDDDELEGAILSALRNEREACAKVLESKALTDPSMFGAAYRNGWNDAVKIIARAIREGR